MQRMYNSMCICIIFYITFISYYLTFIPSVHIVLIQYYINMIFNISYNTILTYTNIKYHINIISIFLLLIIN